ncbi:hypothetical protein PHLCEN_2v688 [Hermanssonia centrifuga]|uniref:Peptidase C14 caspase domain-containing protein n=1 Tax=Hermanssonia centrifuga TaxID=98765 RepID=A0A2R6S5B6_9APHY|nr:hypothetical protein PHLCEN_2v688 [Hermanssonia centrifuga]
MPGKWRYPEQNITVMLDKRVDHSMQPTRKNIIRELRELAKDAQPGDRRVFYFAGHCYQIINRNEEDGLDEALLTHGHNGEPFDAQGRLLDPDNMPPDDPDRKKLEGLIIDNELRDILVDHLPPGVTLVAVFDTCHSGTLLGTLIPPSLVK